MIGSVTIGSAIRLGESARMHDARKPPLSRPAAAMQWTRVHLAATQWVDAT
jgi:hypothetical protein